MAFEMKDLTGSLFKNDRREKDSHPNARGSALINGVEYWVDAWTNEDRNGNKYQALKFKPKDGARGGGTPASGRPNPARYDSELDDDAPFVSCDPAREHRVR